MVFKVGCWNINGLTSKIKPSSVHSSEMSSIFTSFDILGFVETWTSDQSNLTVPGFGYVCKHRKKRYRKGRLSGGLVLYYKSEFKTAVSILENGTEDIMWVKIKGRMINFERDIYLCLTYIKPDVYVVLI